MNEHENDFAALFAEQEKLSSVRVRPGDRVRATVIHVGKDTLFCSLSPTQEASIARGDLLDKEGNLTVKLGDAIDAFVVSTSNGITLSRSLQRDAVNIDILIEACRSAMPVEGTVNAVNKGGVEVTLGGGARGFCPIGQLDVGFVADANEYIGKSLQFLVKEIKENGRNIVLSRRALVERERRENADKLVKTLEVGQRVTAKITRLVDFGAFADLGGIDGLIPLAELSHTRVRKAEDVVREGDQVTVEIKRIDDDPKRPGQKRIGLSLKSMQPEPFDTFAPTLLVGQQVEGIVSRIEPFGAFIELYPGVEGLIHISELSDKRVRHPGDVVKIGERQKSRVVSVDFNQHRIALSLREARDGADAVVGDSEEAKAERELRAKYVQPAVSGQRSNAASLGTFADLFAGGKSQDKKRR